MNQMDGLFLISLKLRAEKEDGEFCKRVLTPKGAVNACVFAQSFMSYQKALFTFYSVVTSVNRISYHGGEATARSTPLSV